MLFSFLNPQRRAPVHRQRYLGFLVALTVVSIASSALGALRNASIDDTYGDELFHTKPQFIPSSPGYWRGDECTECLLKPDVTRTFQSTYLESTFQPDRDGVGRRREFSFQFTGVALYVFLTLANGHRGVTTLTEVDFTLDDNPSVQFRHEPDMGTDEFIYQYPAFVVTGLEHRTHRFRCSIGGTDYNTYINFDFANYTYDDTLLKVPSPITSQTADPDSPQSTKSANGTDDNKPGTTPRGFAGMIAGIVLGCLTFALLVVCLVFFFQRRRRRGQGSPFHHRGDPSTEKRYPDPELMALAGSYNTQPSAVQGRSVHASGLATITPFGIDNGRSPFSDPSSITAATSSRTDLLQGHQRYPSQGSSGYTTTSLGASAFSTSAYGQSGLLTTSQTTLPNGAVVASVSKTEMRREQEREAERARRHQPVRKKQLMQDEGGLRRPSESIGSTSRGPSPFDPYAHEASGSGVLGPVVQASTGAVTASAAKRQMRLEQEQERQRVTGYQPTRKDRAMLTGSPPPSHHPPSLAANSADVSRTASPFNPASLDVSLPSHTFEPPPRLDLDTDLTSTSTGASRPSNNDRTIEGRIRSLQTSIQATVHAIQAEEAAMAASGIGPEQIARDSGLGSMRESLRVMQAQLAAVLQTRSGVAPLSAVSRMTELPQYESPTGGAGEHSMPWRAMVLP